MFPLHQSSLTLGYFAVLVAPLLWVLAGSGAPGFGLGFVVVATGIVGLAALLVQFVSSGRFETLSGRVGIDRTMRFHQRAAIGLTVVVVLHPLLAVWPESIAAIADVPRRLLRMFAVPYLATGTVALACLVAMVTMGVWRRRLPVPYEFWRATHALLAIVVAIAGTHHAVTVGLYSGSGLLHAGWLALLAVALCTLGYVYLVKPFSMRRRAYRVSGNRLVAPRTREIVLSPAGSRRIDYHAGQFAWVLLDQPALPLLDHPFSFSSAPQDSDELKLLVKARGDFTGGLDALPLGARALIDGPHGNFTLAGRDADSILLVAGGIGIAPVISLLRHLVAVADPRPVGLIYGAASSCDLVHVDELKAATQRIDLQLQLLAETLEPTGEAGRSAADAESVPAVASESDAAGVRRGRVDAVSMRAALRGDPARSVCFLCGPPAMIDHAQEALSAAGVPRARIVFERFEYG